MVTERDAADALARAIKQLRQLDRHLRENGFRVYSEPLRDALAELENARTLLAAEGSGRLLAYRGKEGCTSPLCTRLDITDLTGPCYGWHCARCDEPCSYQGHENCTPAPEGSDGL